MKYYQIDVSCEPKIIGVNNGVYQVEIDQKLIERNQNYVDFDNHFSGYNIEFWNTQSKVKELNPPLIRGEMLKKAKVTDVMGYAQNFHFLYNIYSKKYINILKTFNVGYYKTFEFKIKNVDELYYLLFIQTITLDKIFYEKSTVVTGHKIMNNIKYHTIKSPQEYIDFNAKFPTGRFEKLAISKGYYGKDIIKTEIDSLPFYSEKLIDFLLDCGITGLQVSYNNSIELEFV